MVNFKNLKNSYIIAEAGVNHNADINLAFKLVKAAKNSGADAVKFQLFKIKEQVSDIAINAPYQRKGSGKQKMTEMAKHYDLDWEQHVKIKAYCDELDIDYLSSCCDTNAVDFLIENLEANLIKISSGEITNLRLLEYASKKNVPIILSTGMATIEEIDIAVKRISKNLKSPLILLHCISNYPADEEDLNLNAIVTLRNKFRSIVGYSDHSLGYNAAIAAIAVGSKVIEKHFTLDKTLPGPDHSMALEPNELKEFVEIIRNTEKMMGNGEKVPSIKEEEMKKIFRRGVISNSKINAGEVINLENIAIKRPALGIDAIDFEKIIGKRLIVNIDANTPIYWNMIE